MKLYILSAVFILQTIPLSFAQTYNISYSLKNDDKFITSFVNETSMKQTVMGIEQSIDMKMEMSFNHHVVENTQDDGYELITEYRRVYLKVAYAFDQVEINTDRHDSTDLLSSMMKRMMNKPFSICLSDKGEITQIKGFNKYIPETMGMLDLDDILKSQLTDELNNIIGEEIIKQNFSHFFGLYPPQSVRRNEPWNISYILDQSGMQLNFTGKGSLVEATSKTFLIRTEGILQTIESKDIPGAQSFSLTGKQMSEILIDRKNGWPLKSIINQEMAGLLIISETPENPENIEVPMQMRMRMNVSTIP